MDHEEERNLVEATKKNPQAFGLIYDAYYRNIFGYIQRRTGSVLVAQEITSDVFCKALDNIGQYKWRGIPFGAWLYRIAAHEIADRYRKEHRKHKTMINLTNDDDDDSYVLRREACQAQDEMQKYDGYLDLHKALTQLPLKYQEVLTLRFFEGMQFKEIGIILGKPENSVKTITRRGLFRLKEVLEDKGAVGSKETINRR
ncbi:MAG: RNA polymerase sigma factor [Dehalococcoidales bacterium]|nr:RNA polymerase sigma factor [Dehalococcoidales bacterium]